MVTLTGLGCDTHVHVVGDFARYPMLPDRRYTPGPATATSLAAHLERIGLQRAVLVQPSFYGTDNRCLLDTLREMGRAARAVVVLDRDVSAAQLAELDRQGVRGIRINLASVGQSDAAFLRSELEHWAPRLVEHGWHIQIFVPKRIVAACADTIATLPVPCVLDHVAMWDDVSCADASSGIVLALLGAGNLYIKLSASYRVPLPSDALAVVISELIRTRADRLLWASDWPHTSRREGTTPQDISPYRSIAASDLIAERNRWLRSDGLMEQVCVANPQMLYRF